MLRVWELDLFLGTIGNDVEFPEHVSPDGPRVDCVDTNAFTSHLKRHTSSEVVKTSFAHAVRRHCGKLQKEI